MRTPPRTLIGALAAVLAALALSACGNSHSKVTTGTYAGESGANAPYLNVGPLIYEAQLSRQLNPTNSEDASYLQGLGAAESKLQPAEERFAVSTQVYNTGKHNERPAETLTILDTASNPHPPLGPTTPKALNT